jgi:type IV secretory pathway VirB6-like protein
MNLLMMLLMTIAALLMMILDRRFLMIWNVMECIDEDVGSQFEF